MPQSDSPSASKLKSSTSPSSKRKLQQSDVDQSVQDCQHTPSPRPLAKQTSWSEKSSSVHETSPITLSKRQKLSNTSEATATTTAHRGSKNIHGTLLAADEMYNFPSRTKSGGEAGSSETNSIDLTTATNGSSVRKNGIRHPSNGFAPHNGARQMKVKNLRTTTKSSDTKAYLEQIWGKVNDALVSIFSGAERPNFSLEELYKGVENVCRQGHANDLTTRLESKCQSHVEGPVKSALLAKAEEGKSDVDLQKSVLAAWKQWKQQIVTIQWLFFYLDRTYLLKSELRSVQDMNMSIFRTVIVENPTLRPRIVTGCCELIWSARTGGHVDVDIIQESVKMFRELQVYSSIFEGEFLTSTQTFLVQWAKNKAGELPVAEYANQARDFIQRETQRFDLFGLSSSTRHKIIDQFDSHVVRSQIEYLSSQDAIADLLSKREVRSLGNIYALLQRCSAGSRLGDPLAAWIHKTGSDMIFDESSQEQMVPNLLKFKKYLDTVSREAFKRNTSLSDASHKSFEAFINQAKKTKATHGTDNSKPAEMIAKYVDGLMRGGAKVIPSSLAVSDALERDGDGYDEEAQALDEDSQVDSQLEQVLELFRFVHGKAVFEAFYKKDLARRLLMARSASEDAERSMLQRLRTECGAGFTQNLEQMFKDVELSREELKAYKSIMSQRGQTTKVDLSVNVLSSAHWPTYPDVSVIVPQDVKTSIDQFESYYKSKHQGRRLEWKHGLAHCQVRARFPRGTKELIVSSFQAIVLLLFNGLDTKERLSYEHIKAATGLPPNELRRTLQSLACAKLRPLTKHPKGRDIDDSDEFSWDAGFHHERHRVKINQVQLKETKEENKATHEQVAQDRNFEAQAAIVRIMKGRKRITHNELVAEVISATKNRGVLQVSTIKSNIEKLIDKDYIEREDNNEYSYIA